MNSRRVVITGLGVVTSLGEVVDELWENVCAGKSGIGPITRWDNSKYPVRFGGDAELPEAVEAAGLLDAASARSST
jgi:3-oxoacyl-[acyl-carrier-protein] synthase II